MRLRDRADYLPSRRDIVKACRAIQRQWTQAERRRRTVGGGMLTQSMIWTPPQIATANCLARVRKMVAEASA